jgi:hypothetical protein
MIQSLAFVAYPVSDIARSRQFYIGSGSFPSVACRARCIGQTYNGFSYSISGTNITITGYTGSGAATIPSSIPGVEVTVTCIGDSAFHALTNLTSLTLPRGVAAISDYTFFWTSP